MAKIVGLTKQKDAVALALVLRELTGIHCTIDVEGQGVRGRFGREVKHYTVTNRHIDVKGFTEALKQVGNLYNGAAHLVQP